LRYLGQPAAADGKSIHTEKVRSLFDEKAPTWSAKYAAGGRLTGRLSRLIDALNGGIPTDGKVLDLGCGTGELARELATAGIRVLGCDISAEMLSRAAGADVRRAVEWIQLEPDWQVLPCEDGVFDGVVASSVLEYVADPTAVLAECARVIRRGGVLVCTVPDPKNSLRRVEGLVALITRISMLHIGRVPTRLDRYLTYLSISRNRHSLNWWAAAADKIGLKLDTSAATVASSSPLRMLTFRRD
jgi:ubiquinone/menaquinone biosynthesis C-methylase UbiE